MRLGLFLVVLSIFTSSDGCDNAPTSSSGIQKVSVAVPQGEDGLTVEQRNVRDRLVLDNKPGSIKHLYVISAYSGQVILYSTVKGKVTSSGKRLTPTTSARNGDYYSAFKIDIPGGSFYTNEVLQDDGAYGTSVDYLYWWDVNGRYYQIYPNGGQIITLSDQPIPVKSVTINLQERKE